MINLRNRNMLKPSIAFSRFFTMILLLSCADHLLLIILYANQYSTILFSQKGKPRLTLHQCQTSGKRNNSTWLNDTDSEPQRYFDVFCTLLYWDHLSPLISGEYQIHLDFNDYIIKYLSWPKGWVHRLISLVHFFVYRCFLKLGLLAKINYF